MGEEKRKQFNANSWKDGIGGGPGPVRSMPTPSYNKPPPPTSQKFPSKMPPGFDGPPGTEEDTTLMPPPMGTPAASRRDPTPDIHLSPYSDRRQLLKSGFS